MTDNKSKFKVISNNEYVVTNTPEHSVEESYQTNPMYQKLLNFRNLQDKQKKRFSVDDLFKLC